MVMELEGKVGVGWKSRKPSRRRAAAAASSAFGVEVWVERLGRAGADDAAVLYAERGAVAGGGTVLGVEGEAGGEEPVFHGFS